MVLVVSYILTLTARRFD